MERRLQILFCCFALCLLAADARPVKEGLLSETVKGAVAVNVKLQWTSRPLLLSLLPRGKMPPSGPSGGTDGIKNRN